MAGDFLTRQQAVRLAGMVNSAGFDNIEFGKAVAAIRIEFGELVWNVDEFRHLIPARRARHGQTRSA